jgi:hypothetical protein
MAAGGVFTKPSLGFSLGILQVNAGENSWENNVEMAIRHKIYGGYGGDKREKVELNPVAIMLGQLLIDN